MKKLALIGVLLFALIFTTAHAAFNANVAEPTEKETKKQIADAEAIYKDCSKGVERHRPENAKYKKQINDANKAFKEKKYEDAYHGATLAGIEAIRLSALVTLDEILYNMEIQPTQQVYIIRRHLKTSRNAEAASQYSAAISYAYKAKDIADGLMIFKQSKCKDALAILGKLKSEVEKIIPDLGYNDYIRDYWAMRYEKPESCEDLLKDVGRLSINVRACQKTIDRIQNPIVPYTVTTQYVTKHNLPVLYEGVDCSSGGNISGGADSLSRCHLGNPIALHSGGGNLLLLGGKFNDIDEIYYKVKLINPENTVKWRLKCLGSYKQSLENCVSTHPNASGLWQPCINEAETNLKGCINQLPNTLKSCTNRNESELQRCVQGCNQESSQCFEGCILLIERKIQKCIDYDAPNRETQNQYDPQYYFETKVIDAGVNEGWVDLELISPTLARQLKQMKTTYTSFHR